VCLIEKKEKETKKVKFEVTDIERSEEQKKIEKNENKESKKRNIKMGKLYYFGKVIVRKNRNAKEVIQK